MDNGFARCYHRNYSGRTNRYGCISNKFFKFRFFCVLSENISVFLLSFFHPLGDSALLFSLLLSVSFWFLLLLISSIFNVIHFWYSPFLPLVLPISVSFFLFPFYFRVLFYSFHCINFDSSDQTFWYLCRIQMCIILESRVEDFDLQLSLCNGILSIFRAFWP